MKTAYSSSGLAKSSVLLLGLFLAQTNFAATCIWVGAGGDGSWDTQTNWSTFTVPVAGDKVYITNNATFSVNVASDITFASLTVGGTSGTVTMNWKGGSLAGNAHVLGTNAVMNLSTPVTSDHILAASSPTTDASSGRRAVGVSTTPRGWKTSPARWWMCSAIKRLAALAPTTASSTTPGTFRKSAGAGETDISPTPGVALNNTGG